MNSQPFTFTSTEANSTFECKLDSAAYASCSSPLTLSGIANGPHTVSVRATDLAGNIDATPATRGFTVDTTPPDTTITAGPTGTIASASASFSFTADKSGSTFECKLDAAAYAVCTAPKAYAGLADGTHTFTVRAKDTVGNFDPTPATRSFMVDTTAPATTVDSGPGALTNTPTAAFAFHSDDAGATFSCTLDGTATACTSPKSYAGLADGQHTFAVAAKDAVGNTGPAATRTFTVDTTPPPTTVSSGPSGPTTDASPSFGFSSPETSSTFACRLDGPGAAVGSFGACSSPASFSALAPGDYTFVLRATDAAGNVSTTERHFTVTVVQQATPTPTPIPTPTPTPAPAPTFHQTVVIQPAGGTVLVKIKPSTVFVPLDTTKGIPLGSEVDVRKGTVRLFSVPKAGGPAESALFYGGIFKVTQPGGITLLKLSEPLSCPKAGKATVAAKKPKKRHLWGDGSGSFRTEGQYSAATVRGTKWLVQDSCTTTLTRVARGVVQVQDFVTHKTLILRTGKSYTARAKKRR